MNGLMPIPTLNPVLLTVARHSVNKHASYQKSAVVPGMDPSGGAGGGAPPPPADPAMAGGGAAVPPAGGDQASQVAQQVMQMMQQGGGAGGMAGKGKSPKDQIQAGQAKIQIHLLAQICQHLGIKVDPQILVPPTDPATDQMAMQEMQTTSMAPSNDPNAPQGGAGGAPGGAPPGPPQVQPVSPMDPSSGPIGKAASRWDIGSEFPMFGGGEPMPGSHRDAAIDAILTGARKTASLAERCRQAMQGAI